MKVKSFGAVLASLVLACSLLVSGPALAERGRGHGGGGEKMLQKMSTELGLSATQTAQIKQIYESHKPRMQQIHEQMKSTFTEDQRNAMKEMRKNRKGTDGQRPSKEERQAQMAQIGISEGQMQQMRSLREQMKTERESIKSEVNAVLTPDQQAKLEQMKSNWKNRRGKRGPGGAK